LHVFVNGENKELSDGLSLEQLVNELMLPGVRIAIEVNGRVVRRGDWTVTRLNDEDRVEIVHFVGGGGIRRQEQQAGAGKIKN
jgi:thiamine biosynthesis protein ThiS